MIHKEVEKLREKTKPNVEAQSEFDKLNAEARRGKQRGLGSY